MGQDDFQTLNELFFRAAEKHAKPDAFLSKREGRYQGLPTAEALRQTAGLALAMESFGTRRGDRIALLSENRVEWTLTDYAALGLGAIDVPIYPTLLAPDIEYILRDSGSRGIVVSTDQQLRKVLEIKSRLPELKWILTMDSSAGGDPNIYAWREAITAQWARNLEAVDEFRARALETKAKDTATIIYTSGTTGKPKGVVLTHANIVSNVQACIPLFHFNSTDRAISFLPLSHILERMLEYFAFWKGVSIAYAESLETLPQNLLEVRPSLMAVVPRVLEKVHAKISETVRQGSPFRQKLFHWAVKTGWEFASCHLEGGAPSLGLRVQHAVADALVGAKVRARLGGRVNFLISGAAPLSPDLAGFFYAMGLPVYEGYGLTETSPVISVNYPGAVKLGTVGRVLAGVEVKLDEESDGGGGEGREILVRGPNVTPGYHNQQAENQQAFTEGWFHTGDLGTLDGGGYLIITGRKKNLLKTSGGKYVSPEKLEGLFQGHPLVAQMVVVGDTRHFVAALIVPNFDRLEAYARQQGIPFETREQLSLNPQIHSFMQAQVDKACQTLAPFERIRQIALLPQEFSFPAGELSPTQKVRRFVVEARYRELIEEIYRRPSLLSQDRVTGHAPST